MDTDVKTEEIQALKRDIEALRTDLDTLLHSLATDGKTRLGSARMRIVDATKALEDLAQERFRDTYQRVRDEGLKAVESTREQVGKRPLTVTLGAFFIGWIMGKMGRR